MSAAMALFANAVAQAKPQIKEDERVDSDPFYASFPMH
jgi:hypothetical protein